LFYSKNSDLTVDTSQVKKALVSLSIEESFLEIGGTKLLNDVYRILYERFNCYLPDCYDNPEYLKPVYEELETGTWKTFIDFLNSKLEEFAYQKEIGNFMNKISELHAITV
jgi:hypothetical protein